MWSLLEFNEKLLSLEKTLSLDHLEFSENRWKNKPALLPQSYSLPPSQWPWATASFIGFLPFLFLAWAIRTQNWYLCYPNYHGAQDLVFTPHLNIVVPLKVSYWPPLIYCYMAFEIIGQTKAKNLHRHLWPLYGF